MSSSVTRIDSYQMKPMKTKNQKRASTLTLNGELYDASTGLRVTPTTQEPTIKTRHYGSFDVRPSSAMHAGPARSNTLRRNGLAKPQPAHQRASRHVRTIAPVSKHPLVTHFERPLTATIDSPHVVRPSEILSALNQDDTGEQSVGLATQIQNHSSAANAALPPQKPHKPTSHAITEHQMKHEPPRTGIFRTNDVDRSYTRIAKTWKKYQGRIRPTPPVIISAIIAAILIASVLCYLKVPALSLFVAAKSAGVEASYPGYIPSGYHFKGPVTYNDGKVTMMFTAAGGDSSFTIEQKSTPWDSGAVLDNYVLARSSTYLTYSQSGVTIYTFGSQAAWVNAGVLHTIDGTAQLNSEQILRIAGSM